jgi:hypothetical protein
MMKSATNLLTSKNEMTIIAQRLKNELKASLIFETIFYNQ